MNRRSLAFASAAVLVSLTGFLWSRGAGAPAAPAPPAPPQWRPDRLADAPESILASSPAEPPIVREIAADTEERVFSVDSVVARPQEARGAISVRGVVAYVSPGERTAVLVSEAEFEKCGTSCPERALPVRWRGDLPSVADRVVVRGTVERTERGYVFAARGAEILGRGE